MKSGNVKLIQAAVVFFMGAFVAAPANPAQSSNTTTSRSNTQHNTVVGQCTSKGKACTSAQVKALESAGMAAGKRQHGPLEKIKSVGLASSDGTLHCAQAGGTACTEEHLDALNALGASQTPKLTITKKTYNSSHSNTAK